MYVKKMAFWIKISKNINFVDLGEKIPSKVQKNKCKIYQIMYNTSIYHKIEKMFSFVILILEEILHFCIDCMKVTNWGGESNAKIWGLEK